MPGETQELARHAGGRPSSYNPDVAERFLERMSCGELAIELSAEDGMPSHSTVWRWKEAHPEFRDAYARARLMQAQACAEMAVRSGRNAKADDANAARVKMDADKWLAARLDPQNYAERTQLQNLDKNGNPTDAPVRVQIVLVGDVAPQIAAPEPRPGISGDPVRKAVSFVG